MQSERYFIGLDLGGTAIKFGICSKQGEIVQEFQQPTRADKPVKTILEDLAHAIQTAQEFAKQHQLPVAAVGMGTPGSVDVECGYLRGNTPNFKHWKDVKIKQYLEEKSQLPLWVDNDANMMAFGEATFGAGKGFSHVVCVTLGTGIGGGIIVDKELFRGSNYAGGEIGHMSIKFDGEPCRCGGIGCWELYASATAMIKNYHLKSGDTSIRSTKEIFEKYYNNETIAREVVEQEIEMAAVGVANILNIFNPQMVIIGGGVSESGDWFIEQIATEAKKRAMLPSSEGVKIVRAKLGNSAGWLGAAAFACHRLEE
ncbi:MAG: ROK family protein [Calditrichaeota bacterium]|nr:MAG: ROK family protein [Calditrichota bacterium]